MKFQIMCLFAFWVNMVIGTIGIATGSQPSASSVLSPTKEELKKIIQGFFEGRIPVPNTRSKTRYDKYKKFIDDYNSTLATQITIDQVTEIVYKAIGSRLQISVNKDDPTPLYRLDGRVCLNSYIYNQIWSILYQNEGLKLASEKQRSDLQRLVFSRSMTSADNMYDSTSNKLNITPNISYTLTSQDVTDLLSMDTNGLLEIQILPQIQPPIMMKIVLVKGWNSKYYLVSFFDDSTKQNLTVEDIITRKKAYDAQQQPGKFSSS